MTRATRIGCFCLSLSLCPTLGAAETADCMSGPSSISTSSTSAPRDPFRSLLDSGPSSLTVTADPIPALAMPAAWRTATVPMVNLGRLMIVEAELNGARRVRLVVDTGASYTVLFPEVVRAMGLLPSPEDPDLSLWTAGGEVGAQMVTLRTVQVGHASVQNLPVAVLGLPNPPEGIDGLLGLSFLNHFIVTLDPQTSQLRLSQHD